MGIEGTEDAYRRNKKAIEHRVEISARDSGRRNAGRGARQFGRRAGKSAGRV